MSLVFNDKTFQQADEGTVNVLKYTFGNGVNLVFVQQESFPDCYPESCLDPHLVLCFALYKLHILVQYQKH